MCGRSLEIGQREGDYRTDSQKLPGREGGTGPLENAIVFMLLPRLGRCPNPVGKDEQALGRKMRGGRYGRGLAEGVSPSNNP